MCTPVLSSDEVSNVVSYAFTHFLDELNDRFEGEVHLRGCMSLKVFECGLNAQFFPEW